MWEWREGGGCDGVSVGAGRGNGCDGGGVEGGVGIRSSLKKPDEVKNNGEKYQ